MTIRQAKEWVYEQENILEQDAPKGYEELSTYTNSDEYNMKMLEICERAATAIVENGEYPVVYYGLRRFGLDRNCTAPCLIPMTWEQAGFCVLDRAIYLNKSKSGRALQA
jgi:hypothetical protein